MKVSVSWLQKYFDTPLPAPEAIADALTFHAFEIEEIEGDMLDVKVLPNRSADCLSHRGLAYELSAILDIPMKQDPLRAPVPVFPSTDKLTVTADPAYVLRHTGALILGVKMGPSPEWLKSALESVGQRSINNVVDVLNFVMLDMGQPSGAFDVGKMKLADGVLKIDIRRAKAGEKIKVLTGEEYTLTEDMFAFTDATSGELLDIAGVKGGLDSGVTNATTDLFISAGTYDATLIRRTAQKLKLFTDASLRFQNKPSPELTAYGMQALLKLIPEVAGGEVVGVVDVYPTKAEPPKPVSTTYARMNAVLGSTFTKEQITDVFRRLGLEVKTDGDAFTVTPSFERTDLVIPEDLAEEVGQIIGYDKIPSKELSPLTGAVDQSRFRGIERMKDSLITEGFTEVSTQSFVKKGDITLANPLDVKKPGLRVSLEENLMEALERAKRVAPLVLEPNEKPKLFEVGSVFPKEGEYMELRMTERVPAWGDAVGTTDNLSVAKLEDYGKDYEPKRYALGAYKPFSVYPFVLRDIALWTPAGTESKSVETLIRDNAGALLARIDAFDRFEKDGRVSYAFRLVFESMEKTLTDGEVNTYMEKVVEAAKLKGFEVR